MSKKIEPILPPPVVAINEVSPKSIRTGLPFALSGSSISFSIP